MLSRVVPSLCRSSPFRPQKKRRVTFDCSDPRVLRLRAIGPVQPRRFPVGSRFCRVLLGGGIFASESPHTVWERSNPPARISCRTKCGESNSCARQRWPSAHLQQVADRRRRTDPGDFLRRGRGRRGSVIARSVRLRSGHPAMTSEPVRDRKRQRRSVDVPGVSRGRKCRRLLFASGSACCAFATSWMYAVQVCAHRRARRACGLYPSWHVSAASSGIKAAMPGRLGRLPHFHFAGKDRSRCAFRPPGRAAMLRPGRPGPVKLCPPPGRRYAAIEAQGCPPSRDALCRRGRHRVGVCLRPWEARDILCCAAGGLRANVAPHTRNVGRPTSMRPTCRVNLRSPGAGIRLRLSTPFTHPPHDNPCTFRRSTDRISPGYA